MPIYEYRCDNCGETVEKFRPVSEYKEPFVGLCTGGEPKGKVCEYSRILSPTPTTFRFNDNTGFKGLDKRTRGR